MSSGAGRSSTPFSSTPPLPVEKKNAGKNPLEVVGIAPNPQVYRAVGFALLQVCGTTFVSFGEASAAYIMREYGSWPCYILGLLVYGAGALFLLLLRAKEIRAPWRPAPREVIAAAVDKPAPWKLPSVLVLLRSVLVLLRSVLVLLPSFLVLLTSFAYNPLFNSISAPVALQYISSRFSTTIGEAARVVAIGNLFAMFGPAVVLVRFALQCHDTPGPKIELALGTGCLVLATFACVLMAIAPSLWFFQIELCFAHISTSYNLLAKSLLAAWSPRGWHFEYFTAYQFIQTVGRFLTGWILDQLFQIGLKRHFLGWLYIGPAGFCAVALVCILGVYFSRVDDEADEQAPESPDAVAVHD